MKISGTLGSLKGNFPLAIFWDDEGGASMIDVTTLQQQEVRIGFREVRNNTYKIIVPFYHEDGDMYDIFVNPSPNTEGMLRISDFALTLMKLSYSFEIDSINKKKVLQSIVTQNNCIYENGVIYLEVEQAQFMNGLYAMAQVISKVMNMEIISKEIARSYFYEYLKEFVTTELRDFNIKENTMPIAGESDFSVDFEIAAPKPIYLFGVKDDAKASRVVISCLNFNERKLPYRSLVIHEDIEALTKYSKRQILNTTDKQFYNLDDFKAQGNAYLHRETA